MSFISISFRFLVPLGSISIHVFSDSLIVEFAFVVTPSLDPYRLLNYSDEILALTRGSFIDLPFR